ncbi:MAG: DUF2304 domain-containing protein [Deferribacteres bacterium]|nr:DUF2304 domain-containing protein [candidate division KSB1 bacterium]MCB9503370.1 DUF2304 domain-containing protein [Deferribacteres bacterium]
MSNRIELFAILGSLAIAFAIFELIRKGKLQEKYSLLWFGSALVLLVLSCWKNLLEIIANLLGVYYAPSALFLIAAFFGILLALHFTLVISELSEKNKTLAQEVGLLSLKIDLLEKKKQTEETN